MLLLPSILFQLYSCVDKTCHYSGVMVVINLFILLILVYHLKLCFDSIIEDYVHNPHAQLVGKLLLNLSCIFIVKVVVML